MRPSAKTHGPVRGRTESCTRAAPACRPFTWPTRCGGCRGGPCARSRERRKSRAAPASGWPAGARGGTDLRARGGRRGAVSACAGGRAGGRTLASPCACAPAPLTEVPKRGGEGWAGDARRDAERHDAAPGRLAPVHLVRELRVHQQVGERRVPVVRLLDAVQELHGARAQRGGGAWGELRVRLCPGANEHASDAFSAAPRAAPRRAAVPSVRQSFLHPRLRVKRLTYIKLDHHPGGAGERRASAPRHRTSARARELTLARMMQPPFQMRAHSPRSMVHFSCLAASRIRFMPCA